MICYHKIVFLNEFFKDLKFHNSKNCRKNNNGNKMEILSRKFLLEYLKYFQH